MIFRYTDFLERENKELKKRIEKLETRNQELVIALVTRTPLAEAKVEPKHRMAKSENRASCSCGWNFASQDPVVLQSEITKHYQGNVMRGGRATNWPQNRQRLEAAAETTGDKE